MYSTVDEIEAALANLAAAHPAVSTLHAAPHATHEGRTVHVLRIGADPDADGVAILGGVHAREWVPPEACVNLAADLLEAYTLGTGLGYGGATFSAAEIARAVSTMSLYVLACVNPDGRAWSQGTEPLWRKNRCPGPQVGVDINRNFDFLWDHTAKFAPDADVATSSSPADPTYRGPSAASEPETRNVVWLLETFPIRWHVDVHSAVPVVLHSWGSDTNQSTDAAMTFRNPAYDAVRGRVGDAVGEYIDAGEESTAVTLARRIADAVAQVRGSAWPVEQAMTLYPTSGASDDYAYSRHAADPAARLVLGWTIECGTTFQPAWSEAESVIAETSAGLLRFAVDAHEVTDGTRVTLTTPSVAIEPEAGSTTATAVTFAIEGARDVTLSVVGTTGPFALPLAGEVVVPGPGHGVSTTGRVWVAWTAGAAGSTAAGSIRLRCPETAQEWSVPITALARPAVRTALALAIDESGSMLAAAGDGRTRAAVLREAATVLVSVLHPDEEIGIVGFSTDARVDLPAVAVGPEVFGAGRAAASAVVAGYTPDSAGLTSIGDGVVAAQAVVASATVDHRAVLLLTDGQQTAPAWIADVAPGEATYAVGLGTPEAIDPAALTALTNGGYVVVTGELSVDERLLLAQYFLRVLAGATNTQIALG